MLENRRTIHGSSVFFFLLFAVHHVVVQALDYLFSVRSTNAGVTRTDESTLGAMANFPGKGRGGGGAAGGRATGVFEVR